MAYLKIARPFRAWVPYLLPCFLFLWVASAHAAGPAGTPKQQAKAHFLAGQSHYNLGELPEAITEFKEAYRLYPDPAFLYNLGQCSRQIGKSDEAIRFYRNFLREEPNAPNRSEVLQRIAELEAEQAKSQEEVKPAAVAPVPPVSQPPIATRATPVSPEPRVDLTTAPAQPPTQEPPTATRPVYKKWWFWTAAAAVAVGVGIGIYAAASGGASAPSTALGAQSVF